MKVRHKNPPGQFKKSEVGQAYFNKKAEQAHKFKWEYAQFAYVGAFTKEARFRQRMLNRLAPKIDDAINRIYKELGAGYRINPRTRGQYTIISLPKYDEGYLTEGGISTNEFMTNEKRKKEVDEMWKLKWELGNPFRADPNNPQAKKFNDRSKELLVADVPEVNMSQRYLKTYAHEKAESALPCYGRARGFGETREMKADIIGYVALKDVMERSTDSKVRAEIQKSFDEITRVDVNDLKEQYRPGILVIKNFLSSKIDRKKALAQIFKA